jgi:hypothetical protein
VQRVVFRAGMMRMGPLSEDLSDHTLAPTRRIRIRIRATVEPRVISGVTLKGVGEHDANEDEQERLRREALLGAVDEKGNPTWCKR